MKEIVYILFLISGILKIFPIYFQINLPIDLTILFALIMIIFLINDFRKRRMFIVFNKYIAYSYLSIFLLTFVILLSFFYSSSDNYIYSKVIQFIALILGFIFPMFVYTFNIEKFCKYFVLLVLITAIFYVPIFLDSSKMYFSSYNQSTQFYTVYKSYLNMGYIIAIALIINNFSNFYKFFYKFLIAVLLIGILILTAARGPLLFFILISLMYYIKLKNISLRKISIVLIITLIIMPFIYQKIDLSNTFHRTIDRFSTLSSLKEDRSSAGRLEHINFVIEKIDASNLLLGYGFASYGIEKTQQDVRLYPHNIFLEVLFELGIIGLFSIILLISIITYKILKNKDFIQTGLYLYLLLNSLKSFSLTDSRIMFGFFALFLVFDKFNSISDDKVNMHKFKKKEDKHK